MLSDRVPPAFLFPVDELCVLCGRKEEGEERADLFYRGREVKEEGRAATLRAARENKGKGRGAERAKPKKGGGKRKIRSKAKDSTKPQDKHANTGAKPLFAVRGAPSVGSRGLQPQVEGNTNTRTQTHTNIRNTTRTINANKKN